MEKTDLFSSSSLIPNIVPNPIGMTWVRFFSKKIFGPFLPHVPAEKAFKYMALTRMVYFFSASSLLILLLSQRAELEKKALESGLPLIEDDSSAHETFRRKGHKMGVIYGYQADKGWTLTEYHQDEYRQKLEKKAFEKARKAQEKALEENRELPPDAIRLHDTVTH